MTTNIGKTPTFINWEITKSTDSKIDFTITKADGTTPFDVSLYEFYFVVRTERNDESKKVIEILDADIAKSDSGSGVTDTFSIDITNSLSDIEQKYYYFEVRSKKTSTGNNDVWFNGYLNVQWTTQEAR